MKKFQFEQMIDRNGKLFKELMKVFEGMGPVANELFSVCGSFISAMVG
jgi:hypothetical protein